MIRRIITTITLVTILLPMVVFSQNKIGFVQSDRIRAEYEEFKDAEAQLQLEYRQVNVQYNTMIVELDSIKKAFETQRLMSSPEWRKEKEAEIVSREATIQKFQVTMVGPEGELYRRQAQLEFDILSKVKSVEEFNDAKNKVSDKIANCARKVQAKEVPLTELAFNVMTSKAPHEYTKTIPQHIRAALQLQTIREIKRGDIISYVKILNKPGVKPVELAKQSEIDAGKYMEFMQSTLDQITSSMNLDFDSILGKPKQTGLDQFFWN